MSRRERVRAAASNTHPTLFLVLIVISEVIGLLLQLVLVWVGLVTVWGDETPEGDAYLRLTWCIIAFVYLGSTVLGLNVLARVSLPDPPQLRVIIGHPLTRTLSTIVGLGASFLGLTVALDLITTIGSGAHDWFSELTSVWAMLLSWAMFNWGHARMFYSMYHRAAEPSLVFPGTSQPGIIDFAYLAFTNATSFAVSDVKVISTRMRWTIMWHTTLAFFFNAVIIALTMNIIINGSMFTELLS